MKDRVVVSSIENGERNRCVDVFMRPDGTFGFDEWRREPEDPGGWSLMYRDSRAVFATKEEAVVAARRVIPWYADRC